MRRRRVVRPHFGMQTVVWVLKPWVGETNLLNNEWMWNFIFSSMFLGDFYICAMDFFRDCVEVP